MSDDKYQPVSCSEYDIYEIAIMRQQCLDLKWQNSHGIEHNQKVKPVDLKIINGAEYLIVELVPDDKSSISEIRLDKIIIVN